MRIFLLTLILLTAGCSSSSAYPFKDTNRDGIVKIAFLGDSTTSGSCCNGGFVTYLQSYYPNIQMSNLGRGGITSTVVANRVRVGGFYPKFTNFDYVFITLGVNDWKKREPTVRNLTSLVNTLKKQNFALIIKVNIPLNMNLDIADAYNKKRRAGQDTWVRQVGKNILASNLPIGARFDRIPITADNFKNDGLHPLDGGYKLMAKVLADYLKGK